MGIFAREEMGCGGSSQKDKDEKAGNKETGDQPTSAPAPAPSAKSSTKNDEMKAQQEGKPETMDDGKPWVSEELRSMMHDYFTRYDLDGSGTINSSEELKQLCTNLVVKLELDMDVKTIDKFVGQAGDMEKECWTFDQFKDWFIATFKPLTCWQPNDCSSSDEDDAEGTGRLRSGTYALTMADTYTCPFKLRYAKAGEYTALYKRVAHDEKLGKAMVQGKEVAVGLFQTQGTFDVPNKTLKLTKTYDVDLDASTKEPIFEFDGKWTSCTKFEGSWKNVETDEAAQAILTRLELPNEGTFTAVKNAKTD